MSVAVNKKTNLICLITFSAFVFLAILFFILFVTSLTEIEIPYWNSFEKRYDYYWDTTYNEAFMILYWVSLAIGGIGCLVCGIIQITQAKHFEKGRGLCIATGVLGIVSFALGILPIISWVLMLVTFGLAIGTFSVLKKSNQLLAK